VVRLLARGSPARRTGATVALRAARVRSQRTGPLRRFELEETEGFRSLSEARRARLRSQLQLYPFHAGEYLYFESQPAEHFWVARTGEVRTLKTSSGGRVTTLERLLPGDFFGMASVLDDATYTETAQGVTDGEAWRAPRRIVLEIIREEVGVGEAFLAMVARRLQTAHDRLCSFAHDSVPARIARAVLEQAEDGRIEITRRALGETVGTTVETTIRVLRSFERAGWIEGGVGWIRILDRRTLEGIAQGDKPRQAR
jgi:CRP/FNR family transcriptional regulator